MKRDDSPGSELVNDAPHFPTVVASIGRHSFDRGTDLPNETRKRAGVGDIAIGQLRCDDAPSPVDADVEFAPTGVGAPRTMLGSCPFALPEYFEPGRIDEEMNRL